MARIGIVIYSLAGAGAERVSVNLSHAFADCGHQVDFILVQGEGELRGEVRPDAGVFVASVASAKGWRQAIGDYVTNERPDVLLAMMEGAGVLSIQSVAKAGSSVPVFVVSHIQFSKHCRQSARLKERLLMPLAARWYLPRAAGVIGVSGGVASDIRSSAGLRPEKVHTVYNPILNAGLEQLASEPVDHPWLQPERDWLTVVSVGRLTQQKSHETLLQAMRLVQDKTPARLLILGQGERLAELRDTARELGIADLVDFPGFVSNPYRHIAAADVFALSSAWEGLPTVLIEALGCGTKVVSTDCPSGPREILAGGRFGLLVPVGDAKALAKGILASKDFDADESALKEHLRQFETKHVAHQYLSLMGL
jgi:glycosyltransferase involved in cell wall biosynthesis